MGIMASQYRELTAEALILSLVRTPNTLPGVRTFLISKSPVKTGPSGLPILKTKCGADGVRNDKRKIK